MLRNSTIFIVTFKINQYILVLMSKISKYYKIYSKFIERSIKLFFIYTQIIKSIYEKKIHKSITNISFIYYKLRNFIFNIFINLKKLEALSILSKLSINEIIIFYILT